MLSTVSCEGEETTNQSCSLHSLMITSSYFDETRCPGVNVAHVSPGNSAVSPLLSSDQSRLQQPVPPPQVEQVSCQVTVSIISSVLHFQLNQKRSEDS